MRIRHNVRWFFERLATVRKAECGQVRFHPSTYAWLITLAVSMCLLASSSLSFRELYPAAISLPVLWCVSVLFRLSAQQFALNRDAGETIWLVGPTGNLSLDYEFLQRRRLLIYALAGQIAGLSLLAVGWLVQWATAEAESLALWQVDFRGGWSNHALATQLFWVNAFLCGLHLLPTVPFDMRALLFGMIRGGEIAPVNPFVLREVSKVVSHLSAIAFGSGVTLLVLSAFRVVELPWYALIGCAVYLFVAAHWEAARANELEQQYSPLNHAGRPGSRQRRRRPTASLDLSSADSHLADIEEAALRSVEEDDGETSWHDEASFPVINQEESSREHSKQLKSLDIDEILRKLHREGRESLTDEEHSFLISTSEQINQKRQRG